MPKIYNSSAFTWVQWQSSCPCPANPRLSEATSNHLPEYLTGSKFFAVIPLIIISIPFPSSDVASSGRVATESAAFARPNKSWRRERSAPKTCQRDQRMFKGTVNFNYIDVSSVQFKLVYFTVIILFSTDPPNSKKQTNSTP